LRRLLLCALAALAVQAAGPAGAQRRDEEPEQVRPEAEVRLPAYPKADGLIEFSVSGAVSFRFFIDPASVSLEPGGEVRYTLVGRSPSGVDNVSYEGIRCAAGAYRVYAHGNDGRWAASRQSDWRRIEPRTVQRWHNELHSNYFCPPGAAVLSAGEALDALRGGGHPALRSTGRAH
jgi:hypothetical protein